MLIRNLKKFVGEEVYVRWHVPDSDWHWQRLIGFEGERVWFRGIDAPDGSKHDGKMWPCAAAEIRSCALLKRPTDTSTGSEVSDYNCDNCGLPPSDPAMDQLDELAKFDVEGAILRQLHDQCRARMKADVPDAPDWMIAAFVDALIGRPRPADETSVPIHSATA